MALFEAPWETFLLNNYQIFIFFIKFCIWCSPLKSELQAVPFALIWIFVAQQILDKRSFENLFWKMLEIKLKRHSCIKWSTHRWNPLVSLVRLFYLWENFFELSLLSKKILPPIFERKFLYRWNPIPSMLEPKVAHSGPWSLEIYT